MGSNPYESEGLWWAAPPSRMRLWRRRDPAATAAMTLTALTLGTRGIEFFAKPPCSLRYADEMKVLRFAKLGSQTPFRFTPTRRGCAQGVLGPHVPVVKKLPVGSFLKWRNERDSNPR